MSWTSVLRSREIDAFRDCRRRWDLGALPRQGLVPRVRSRVFDLDHAVRMGLAVYYFPAMDDWSRQIVRPLALKGFDRAMSEQASAYERDRALSSDQVRDWQRHRRLGAGLLTRYFDFADSADNFDSMFSDEIIWSQVPDPDQPSRDLGMPDGRSIRLATRIDQLISDQDDESWLQVHRVVWDDWTPDTDLLADDVQQRAIWAMEIAYPQLRIAGTIYNELLVRADDPDRFVGAGTGAPGEGRQGETRDMSRVRHPSGFAARQPLSPDAATKAPKAVAVDDIADRRGAEGVRRTVVRRSRGSIQAAGLRLARDVVLMCDPELDVPPNPSPTRCAACTFRRPCDELYAGRDPELMLITDFRHRGDEELEDAGLRRSDERSEQRGPDLRPASNINLRWS